MADFILNAPGTTNNPWTPANVLTPVDSTAGIQTDATGWRSLAPGDVSEWAHNANYGPVITATATIASGGASNGDEVWVGAVVRSGPNAGSGIGVNIGAFACQTGTWTTTSTTVATFTAISAGVSITRANADVWLVTVSISGGTATITCTQNGTAITFTANTTTNFTGEASLAAGGLLNAGNNNTLYLSQFTGTGVLAASAYAAPTPWGPGVSPNVRTMFRPRPVSNYIVPGTFPGVALGSGFALGLLTGAALTPVVGYARTSGPGISPDYKRTFDRIPRSTTLPILTPITGVALGSGYALGSVGGAGALQGLAFGQGSGTANLLGAGALTGLSSGEGAVFGNISTGVVTNITGVSFGSGYAFGTVTGSGALTALASGQGAAVGALAGTGALTGAAQGQSYAYASLGGTAVLAGVVSGSGGAFAVLTGALALQGVTSAQGHALANLTGAAALTGVAAGGGFGAAAPLLGSLALTGRSLAQGFSIGNMEAIASLQGISLGQSFAVGLLLQLGAGQMQGAASGVSFAYGLLSGAGHVFGWANVVAVSQNGLPVARACYIEESSSRVTASYFDASGVPFVPNAVSYRIDDVTSGANIVPWTAIAPDTTNTVTITSAQNAMISLTRASESHQVLFQITDGFGDVSYEDVTFDLIRVAGLA